MIALKASQNDQGSTSTQREEIKETKEEEENIKGEAGDELALI